MVKALQKGDPKAQRYFYDKYAARMLAVCVRYLTDQMEAEDVMISSFMKVFTHLAAFENKGSFEGWMKKITVNEALMYLRKSKMHFQELDNHHLAFGEEPNYDEKLEEKDVLNLLEILPVGYRTVLNLYDVEGYKHKEIADLLGISINTSKSQLILARKKMRELIEKKLNITNLKK